MIILLQSGTIQFRRFFLHISYYKVRQLIFLQSVTECYYKVWQTLLQSASDITKCDSYYKVRRNTVYVEVMFFLDTDN